MLKKIAIILLFCFIGFVSIGFADSPEKHINEPKIVKVVSHHPKHSILKVIPFDPWSKPTVSQVITIINIESLGIAWIKDILLRRVNCESGFYWGAVNGQYEGLGQFSSSTFNRGVSTIGSRLVKMPAPTLVHIKHITIDKHWSDGTITHTIGKRVKMYIKRIYRGYIPSNPPRTHGWAQIRIMRQAIQGVSNVGNSEWSCR